MTAMTTDPSRHDVEPRPRAGWTSLPADPAKYDAPRNAAARRKGLEAPYIAGGEDPELGETLRREARYLRLLVGMAVALVLLGFVLGIAGALIGIGGGPPA